VDGWRRTRVKQEPARRPFVIRANNPLLPPLSSDLRGKLVNPAVSNTGSPFMAVEGEEERAVSLDELARIRFLRLFTTPAAGVYDDRFYMRPLFNA